MAASMRALFAWYAHRELATATAHPAIENQSPVKTPPPFLHLATNIENKKIATERSLPLQVFFSRTDAPSFGASAVVSQNAISRNNKEICRNFSSGFPVGQNRKSFSEAVAEQLESTEKKKYDFLNNVASCKSSSMHALEAFARLGLPKEARNRKIRTHIDEKTSKYAASNALLHYALL